VCSASAPDYWKRFPTHTQFALLPNPRLPRSRTQRRLALCEVDSSRDAIYIRTVHAGRGAQRRVAAFACHGCRNANATAQRTRSTVASARVGRGWRARFAESAVAALARILLRAASLLAVLDV
jgi:hypothetical protein